MSEHRNFRFAFAGALLALLLALLNRDGRDLYENEVMFSLAVAIPAAVFRAMVADHSEEARYRAASGFAIWVSGLGAISAFAFALAGRNCGAGFAFVGASMLALIGLRWGRRQKS